MPVQECTVCGWQQSHGRGETVITCPDCDSMSWQQVDAAEPEVTV